uniref:Putative zinc-finger domain-containing protein n=1 Tax=Candidatus Caldatribacterium californiense TaxID=1454726 RepID=A0A7V4DG45_9BACT
MDCKDLVEKLYFYLDGEVLSEEERRAIEEHLALCRKCCERYEFERLLWDMVRHNGQNDHVPEALIARIEGVIAQF